MTLDEALEAWAVHEPGTWDNDEGPQDWYAVSNDDGIVAYFSEELTAFQYRMMRVNAMLNPLPL